MYNENQLSILRYRRLLFFLFQPRLVLFFIISHSCQKSILSLHEVKFPLTTVRVAEVRHPVSSMLLLRSDQQRKTMRGSNSVQNHWNLKALCTSHSFLCLYCWLDNLKRKIQENFCANLPWKKDF
jgi:hypothetical protein